MRGWRSCFAEVVKCLHDARSEVISPQAIDHDARGQRMVRFDQPASERQAPARLLRAGPGAVDDEWRSPVGQNRRNTRPDELARTVRIATAVDIGWRGMAAIPERLYLRL